MEEYLHQLSARLLGWSRSCEPPAIELVLPAENITTQCYSGSPLPRTTGTTAAAKHSSHQKHGARCTAGVLFPSRVDPIEMAE